MVIFNEVFEYKTFSSQKKIRQRIEGYRVVLTSSALKYGMGPK